MNGKARNMDYKFAIKVLSGAKVNTQSMHSYPGCQNQYCYDIARNMAIQALKEKHENDKPQIPADVEHLDLNIDWSALTEEEQQTLHKLLSKAHQGYLDNKERES